MNIFQVLIGIEPYCRLHPEQLEEVSVSFIEKWYEPGERFLEQGQPVESFAIVASGAAQVSLCDCQGAELVCGTLHHGDIIFDMVLLTGMVSSMSVTCLEQTTLWVQSKRKFLEHLHRFPLIKEFFYKNITTSIVQYYDLNCCRHRLIPEEKGTERCRYPFLQKALSFIEQNYQNPISLDMVARETAMSKFHFSRLFKQYTGLTFKQYLNRQRIKVAKELLTKKGYSVTEVGYAVGFNDASYFSRVFREVEGRTPRDHLSAKHASPLKIHKEQEKRYVF